MRFVIVLVFVVMCLAMPMQSEEAADAVTQRMANYAGWQTVLLFIGTGALVWTLYLTRQANIGFSSVGRAQLRPYIVPGPPVLVKDAKLGTAHISLTWENCGVTPTSNARCNHFIKVLDAPANESFEYHTHDSRPLARVLIGPNRSQKTTGPSISSADIAGVIAETKFAYIWCFIEYEDGTKPQQKYRTEYCFRLRPGHRTGYEWSFESAGPFNGRDDDCMYPPGTN